MSEEQLENPEHYTTRIHRSVSRADLQLLFGELPRRPAGWTFIVAFPLVGILLTISWPAALVALVVIVRRIMNLRRLAKSPYGYEIAEELQRSQPAYFRGQLAFAKRLELR